MTVKQPKTNLLVSNTMRPGILGFAKSISNELASENITVNNIAPGYTRTERLDELAEHYSSFDFVDLQAFIPELDTPQKRNVANFKIGMARQVPILQEHPTPGHFWYPPETAAAYHLEHSIPKMDHLAQFVRMVTETVAVDAIHDVGANAGLFAAFCSSVTAVPVVCYEPIPMLVPYIIANAPDATVQRLAIGNRSAGAVEFYVNTQSLQTSALDRNAIVENSATVSRIEVAMERLDALAAGATVVKIDVQGAELEVLAGMSGSLDDCQAMLIESTYLSLDTVTDIIPLARAAGFRHLYVVNDVSFGADVLITRIPIRACEAAAPRAFEL